MTHTFKQIGGIDVYTSSPAEHNISGETYLSRLRQVAQWSDRHGCRGMLIYTDNRSIDPWVMAQDVISHTETLSPLIAVQPVYMHPYAAAQKIAALARVYGRSVDLNFVAGGFQFDLNALDDRVPHDARYERLSEYGLIVKRLLAGERVSIQGDHYRVFGLKLEWKTESSLLPRITVSGSSPAGLKCAEALHATAVTYPKPIGASQAPDGTDAGQSCNGLATGIRIGILARETRDEAWQQAMAWFPEDTRGQSVRKAAAQTTDSSWLHQLSTLSDNHYSIGKDIYWMGPFASAKSFCPYLVGSYDEVAAYLSLYLRGGVRLIILDCPREEADLVSARIVIRKALAANLCAAG
ncbi:MAG: LLM class flavin-dependent oxidoreductase [Acidobacteriia bacterium]|nr:LLM class flavin-dependent oxidoreductase [Terriglobia bacterium]